MMTHRQRTHRRQIPTLATLHLHHKHPISTRTRTLLNRIARIHQRIQTRIAPQTKLRHRHIITNRRRQMHHRNMERRIMFPRLIQNRQCPISLEPANHDQGVEFVLLELRGDTPEVDVWEFAVGAQFGAAAGHPVVDAEPGELVDVVVEEAGEPVVDGEWFVALADTVADCCSGGGVHATSGGTDAKYSMSMILC